MKIGGGTKTNHRAGLMAEALSRLSLRLRGYRIVASRYRSPRGEIDILAAHGSVLAVVEVKTRGQMDDALAAVSPRQWARLYDAANDFLAHAPRFSRHTLRFDMMAVGSHSWPRHIPDAWRPEI